MRSLPSPFSFWDFSINHSLHFRCNPCDTLPVSETALTSAPYSTRHIITGSFPETAAHQSGVTQCKLLSSGTSYIPRCSMSTSHTFIRYSTISTWPLLQATNRGVHPSLDMLAISRRSLFDSFSSLFRN